MSLVDRKINIKFDRKTNMRVKIVWFLRFTIDLISMPFYDLVLTSLWPVNVEVENVEIKNILRAFLRLRLKRNVH